MSIYDYLLLFVIAVWAVSALIHIIKGRKKPGCCNACCRNCSCCKK